MQISLKSASRYKMSDLMYAGMLECFATTAVSIFPSQAESIVPPVKRKSTFEFLRVLAIK
jgi:hypothetical protein